MSKIPKRISAQPTTVEFVKIEGGPGWNKKTLLKQYKENRYDIIKKMKRKEMLTKTLSKNTGHDTINSYPGGGLGNILNK